MLFCVSCVTAMITVFLVCSLKGVWMKQVYLEKFYKYKPVTGQQSRAGEPNQFKAKLREIQSFFGLEQSGDVDPQTMRRACCGLSDVEQFRKTMRWTNKTLTCRISRFSSKLTGAQVRTAFRQAWKLWAQAAPLKFRRKRRSDADIVISLNNKGCNLLAVAVHEFGHALGLPHSSDPGAIMFPAYNFGLHTVLQLSFQDIKDIQEMYGKREISLDRLPPKTPDKCYPTLSFDAVTGLQQELVFFKDRESGSLLSIRGGELFQSKASTVKSIDAALYFRETRLTDFFIGEECWRFDEDAGWIMKGFPKPIAHEWLGIDSPVDAAVAHDGCIYFFMGPQQLEFNPKIRRVTKTMAAHTWLQCREIKGS